MELDKPDVCDNKLSIIIQEELFRSLKIETEDMVKRLIEHLNDIKTGIRVNEAKIIKEKDDYANNREQLIATLETEMSRIKEAYKKNSHTELACVQNRGEVVKENLIVQFESLRDINEQLVDQHNNLFSNLEQLKQHKNEQLDQMEEDMIKNYEISGNDNLAKIEAAYLNIIKNQRIQVVELTDTKSRLTEVVKNLNERKRAELDELYGNLKS